MMAMPVEATMPVMTSAVATMTAMATVTVAVAVAASENLSRDGQGGSGQCQRRDTSRYDCLDPRHGPLRSWAARGSPCDNPT
jgi:hypothetical protein